MSAPVRHDRPQRQPVLDGHGRFQDVAFKVFLDPDGSYTLILAANRIPCAELHGLERSVAYGVAHRFLNDGK